MNFPPPFRSLHSLPFIAFHYLLSPFIAFYRRPISLSAHSLLPRFVLTSPRFVLVSPRFVLPSPRSLTMPPHSPASHLLPSCFITPFVSHIRLSRTIVCAPLFCFPFFTPFVLLPPLFLLSPIVLRPLFYFFPLCFTHSIVLHLFALLTPLFYTALLYSLPLFTPLCFTLSHCLHPLRFIYSHCFAPVFLLPGNLRKPVPGTAKGNVFLIFQRNFAKSP